MAERDIANLLSTKYSIILHDRKILSETELDIYIPDLKVAIEFIRTRYQTMKKNLVEQELGSEDMTEDEIMIALGFMKVYDRGNLRLEYTE